MNSTTSELHSQAFDLLRFPLSVLVVCEHVFCQMQFHGIVYGADNYAAVNLFETIRKTLFSDANVPVFFLISGFLFFYNVDFNADVYKRKIRSRVKTLLIPYLMWNTIAILLTILPLIPAFTQHTLDLSFSNILRCYWINYPGITRVPKQLPYPINVPLWYLRDLMITILLAPVIYYMIRRFKRSIVLLFGAVWFIFSSLNPDIFAYNRTARIFTALFFFSWGAYLSINRVNMLEKFGRIFKPSIIVYLLTCGAYIVSTHYFPDYSSIVHRLTIISFVIVSYDIAVLLLRRNVCKVSKFLAGGSFFIYLAHSLLYTRIEMILFATIHPIDNATLFAIYILTLATTVLSLLTVYYLLKRFAPTILKILTGRC